MLKYISIILSFISFSAVAQELNCSVQVLSPQIFNTEKRIFESLQKSVVDFMNTTKWTSDNFATEERIECSILINVTEKLSSDEFKATIQIQSRRPVYKASYNSTLLNINDQEFQFKYIEFQPMEYNENAFVTNLTSVLAYYAYLIIAVDYDSFSLYGGTPYYQKAQKIVGNAQNAPEKGWKSFEGIKNRYWIVENLLEKSFFPIRDCFYKYHRLGLDIMTDKKEDGRAVIIQSLELMKTLNSYRPLSYNAQLFFAAKADELVNIFSQADPSEKNQVVSILSIVDPGNTSKYQKLGTN